MYRLIFAKDYAAVVRAGSYINCSKAYLKKSNFPNKNYKEYTIKMQIKSIKYEK